MGPCILEIIDPQGHLPHLCRPFSFDLLAGMNGEEVHSSRHGSARCDQLSMELVSRLVPSSRFGGATYRNAVHLSLFVVFGDPVPDQGRNCGTTNHEII